MKFLRLAFLPVLMALASVGHAQSISSTTATPRPAFTLDRLSLGVRGEYKWTGQDASHIFNVAKTNAGAGLSAAYALVPKLDAIARVIYYVNSRPEYAVGVNLEIFNGPERAIKAGR